nr:hypothetical protein [Marinicella sp. W31]MDC2879292.1 hypothetical protein [Marinicella sp. W31]
MDKHSLGAAERVIDHLMQLHPKGFDLSLERIRILLGKLGNPHLSLPPVIHIAGTNGKGSASAFTRALLEAGAFLFTFIPLRIWCAGMSASVSAVLVAPAAMLTTNCWRKH